MTHRLNQFLDEREMSAAELARQLEVSESLVSLVINGKRRPSGELRYRFAVKFGLGKAQDVFEADLEATAGGPTDAALDPRAQAPALSAAA
jgi:transcriptional regulator with XRE-family HTH domain